MNKNSFQKTKIFNANEKNVRVYTITDESVYLFVENIPFSLFLNENMINFKLCFFFKEMTEEIFTLLESMSYSFIL